MKILSGAVSETDDDFFQFENRFEKFVHFCVHVYKSFIGNRCMIRASALSYTSLLALIPLLAVAISVTSSLLKQEGEQKIYQGIDKFVAAIVPPAPASNNVPAEANSVTNQFYNATNSSFATGTNQAVTLATTNSAASTNQAAANLASLASDQRVVSAQKSAAKSIHEFVKNMQSATLGVTGMLVLIFVAIRMLANIEATFNDIWGITRGRSWVWRIVLYWTTITLGPIAVVGAVGLAGSSQLHTVKHFFQQMPFIGSLLFDFIPVVLLWLIFSLVYLLVPNTKVNFSAAFIGGVVGGTAWHLNNVFGFLFASRLVTNSKIYGSMALVPVFMVGLYFSWVILLFGAQVAFAFQNRKSYFQEKLVVNVNHRGREFVALRLMTCLGQRFQAGLRPPTVSQLAGELNIPGQLTQSVLSILAYKQLVTEVAGGETAYVPARPLETINAHDILNAIRTGNGQELPIVEKATLDEIYGEFARIEEAERSTAAAISLRTLVSLVPRPASLPGPESAPDTEAVTDVESIEESGEIPAPPVNEEPMSTPMPQPEEPASQPSDSSAEVEKHPATEAKRPASRDVVMPDENRDFPL